MSRLWATAKRASAAPLRPHSGGATLEGGRGHGWDEGHTAGLAEGRATVEAEVAAERALLAELLSGLDALEPPPVDALAGAIEAIAARLAIAAAGVAAVDPALLEARARACAELLSDTVGPARLRLHPHDLHLLHSFDLPVEGDWTLPRGSVRAEVGDAWASDGVAEACSRIASAVGL